jgi:hypothetical protein
VKKTKMENKSGKIKDFLIQAHTFRNLRLNENIIPDEYGMCNFKFEKDGLVFSDRFIINGHIIGQEVVSENRETGWFPVWAMIYNGTFVTDKRDQVFNFLRVALQLINFDTHALPVRGPKEMIVSNWRYQNTCSSKSLSKFEGKEVITFDNKEMYTSSYSGLFIE